MELFSIRIQRTFQLVSTVISIPRVAHSFDLLRNLHILPPRKDQIAIQGIAGIEPAGHYRQ